MISSLVHNDARVYLSYGQMVHMLPIVGSMDVRFVAGSRYVYVVYDLGDGVVHVHPRWLDTEQDARNFLVKLPDSIREKLEGRVRLSPFEPDADSPTLRLSRSMEKLENGAYQLCEEFRSPWGQPTFVTLKFDGFY